jgi:thiol:disulfide interchange protein
MSWLFLLLAAAAFLVAFTTHSVAVLTLSILVALGFTAAWLMGLMAQRVGDSTRSEAMIIDPQELRRLREQAEARRNQTVATPTAEQAPSAESIAGNQAPQ